MAQEGTQSVSVSGSFGGMTYGPLSGEHKFNITTLDKAEGVVTLQTSGVDAQGTAIPLDAQIASLQVAAFKNLHATRDCTVGIRNAGTYQAIARLKPGRVWEIPSELAANAWYGQAIGGAVDLQFLGIPT